MDQGTIVWLLGTIKDPFKFTVKSFSRVQLPWCRFEVGRKLDLYMLMFGQMTIMK